MWVREGAWRRCRMYHKHYVRLSLSLFNSWQTVTIDFYGGPLTMHFVWKGFMMTIRHSRRLYGIVLGPETTTNNKRFEKKTTSTYSGDEYSISSSTLLHTIFHAIKYFITALRVETPRHKKINIKWKPWNVCRSLLLLHAVRWLWRLMQIASINSVLHYQMDVGGHFIYIYLYFYLMHFYANEIGPSSVFAWHTRRMMQLDIFFFNRRTNFAEYIAEKQLVKIGFDF